MTPIHGTRRLLPVLGAGEWGAGSLALMDDLFTAAGLESPAGIAPIEAQVQAGHGPVGAPPAQYAAVIATDGACSGNPGPGGWAWVEQHTGAHASGGSPATTNNIMELTAMISALEFAGPECSLLIRCDSQYVVNIMTQWGPAWRKRGWRKADKKPVQNLDLVKRVLELYEGRTGITDVEWVKGHAGDAANELADTLAVEQSRKYS